MTAKGIHPLLALAIRLLLAGTACALILHSLIVPYANLIIPPCEAVITHIQPDYQLKGITVDQRCITIDTAARRKIVDNNGNPGIIRRDVSASFATGTLAVAPMIALTLILAWPGIDWKRRSLAVAMSIPLLAAATLADLPFTLAWQVEDTIAADFPSTLRSVTIGDSVIQSRIQGTAPLRYWNTFLQSGGRHLFGVLVSLLAIAPLLISKKIMRQGQRGKS